MIKLWPQYLRINLKSYQAFTLPEVMVVIIIMGALVSLAIPKYTLSVEQIRSGEGIQTLTVLLAAQKRYFLENNAYKAGTGGSNDLTATDLDLSIPASTNFNVPKIYNDASGVATITRNAANPQYTLKIAQDGTISCSNLAGNFCATLKYATY